MSSYLSPWCRSLDCQYCWHRGVTLEAIRVVLVVSLSSLREKGILVATAAAAAPPPASAGRVALAVAVAPDTGVAATAFKSQSCQSALPSVLSQPQPQVVVHASTNVTVSRAPQERHIAQCTTA